MSDQKFRVVLEGCKGEWAGGQYLPVLLDAALAKRIELWAFDLHSICYTQTENAASPRENLTDVDFVFVVTPDWTHCNVAKSWLERMSSEGAIFIEKPLDASLPEAHAFQKRLEGTRSVVYGFDHYLASAQPFLQNFSEHLRQLGSLKRVDIRILEPDPILPHRARTLEQGLVFDLLPHALAIIRNTIRVCSPGARLRLRNVVAARCLETPPEVPDETFAHLEYDFQHGLKNIPVEVLLGKYVGEHQDKEMVITGSNGRFVLDLQSKEHYVFYDSEGIETDGGSLDRKPVERFLGSVLHGGSPLKAPGVLSFEEALDILELLDKAKQRISRTTPSPLPPYQSSSSVDDILKQIREDMLVWSHKLDGSEEAPL